MTQNDLLALQAKRALAAAAVTSGRGAGNLAGRAIAGVLRHAQEGELPLFAWTLGLSQPDLLGMIGQYFPELGALEPMPQREYAAIERAVPASFRDLARLLFAHRSAGGDARLADWLARAIAAACFGCRHLWQDLGLPNRSAVSALLEQHFQTLYRRNAEDLKWKRFLFAELGSAQGNPGMRPPACDRCDQFRLCFPAQ